MSKNLLVVDSVLKARTIWSALTSLGRDEWLVLDYPVPPTEFPRKLSGGINMNGGFEPLLASSNKDRLSRIIDVCRDVDAVYLCFDPTLGGEESSVYLLNAISPHIDFGRIHRVRFGLLTTKNIQKAIDKPASFDHFSADKSETLRLADRMVEYNIRTALGGKAIYDSDVGLCGYYAMSLLCNRYTQRRQHVQKVPEFCVTFRAKNGSRIRSVDSYFQSGATKVAEICMTWLGAVHRIGNVTGEDVVIPPGDLHTAESLVLDCTKSCDMRMASVVDNMVAMYHEGLITNPYSKQKITPAYSKNVIEYLKSFDLTLATPPPEELQGIVPIDIRLDMNKINKRYRPVYRRIWQRTLQAYGPATVLRKTTVKFTVADGHTAGGDDFLGTYFDVVSPGHTEFFNKVQCDTIPDNLEDVVLERRPTKIPSYYTEAELLAELLPSFSVFEIDKSLGYLRDAKFLRTGTSTLLIPTFRGLMLSFAVSKHLPQLGQLPWIQDIISKVSQPRDAARTALANVWTELKPAIQSLDKHKFLCEQSCPKCSATLAVVFDKEREPYLLCQKTDTGGCGAVHPILVTEKGNIIVFEPYLVSRPCPKCELSTMRCHNGPYGLFARCDSCGKTQPYE